jgi:copper homeostasis protein
MITLEIVASTVQSCINAEKGGAKRIELCSALKTAGVTPSAGLIRAVKAHVSIPVFVMIRPREGDFIYSSTEVEVMKRDIEISMESGADGLVFGVLNKESRVDSKLLRDLVSRCGKAPVTFHRAFDVTADPDEALEVIIDSGCSRILTSGCASGCLQGREMLHRLAETAKNRIGILPGGGITVETISEIFHPLILEYHMSARSIVKSPADAIIFETDFEETDENKVKEVMSLAHHFFTGIQQ